MRLVDVELEEHVDTSSQDSRTSTNSPKYLSHSIEEILKKPACSSVPSERTDKKLKTSECTQSKIKTDAPTSSPYTGVSLLFVSFKFV